MTLTPLFRNFVLISAFVLLSNEISLAQNLVPNGSFEEYSVCPASFTATTAAFKLPGWKSGGLGPPDHFHYCSRGDASVPYNWAGIAEAYEGDGYAGIYMWTDDDTDYREYLRCKLAESLIKDSTYYIELHYKVSSYSNYSIDRIGLALTAENTVINHDRVIEYPSALNIIRDSALTKFTGIWEAARFEYKAMGDETLLTIGNFFTNEKTKSHRLVARQVSEPMLAHGAYYYIDAVLVVPKFKIQRQLAENVAPGFVPERAAFNTPYVLKNIQFEINSATLTPGSFAELDRLSEFLFAHKEIKIEISGHTDDVGEDAYNMDLSRKRAESVKAYLISKQIEASSISSLGYGKTQPLIQSTSTDARKLNRRVEVRFIR
jgi:OOP family OmpA-OmpF porin